MGLLYNTTLLGTNSRSVLIVAPAALALIVLLLWFGSIRNPDPLSADEGRALSECPQASLESCEDTALKAMHFVAPTPKSASDSTTTGESLWATATVDTRTGSEKCLLPGIPCLLDLGLSFVPIGEQDNGRCIFIGNPCPPIGWIAGQSLFQGDLKTY